MFNLSKSKSALTVVIGIFFLTVLVLPADAIDLPFDPNDYNFLIYDPEGTESRIIPVMEKLGIPYTLRDSDNEVTANDLTTHDILIVGENYHGYLDGLSANVLAAGITGRVILSGHDLDQHTDPGWGVPIEAAETMLIQAIAYILDCNDGAGLLTLGCSDAFSYLPQSWNVAATYLGDETGRDDVNEFTTHGLHSGFFDGLDPCDLSDWNKSYHNLLTIEQDSNFVPFELNNDGNFVTIARTNYGPMSLAKTDDTETCVEPLDTISYTICYDPCGYSDTNVVVVDTLPDGVDYSSSSPDGNYNSTTRTVTWGPYDLSGSDSNCITLTVKVNVDAIPGENIKNIVEMYGDSYLTSMSERTCVDCWADRIIYVDADANEGGDGFSWQTAFDNLQDAMVEAENVDCNKVIWAATGTYQPVSGTGVSGWSDYSFELFDGLGIVGHFEGNEVYPTQRKLDDSNFETILTGQIGQESYQRVQSVITGNSVTNVLLDGLTVSNAYSDNIYLHNDSNVAIFNCKVTNGLNDGMELESNSFVSAHNCTFFSNEDNSVNLDSQVSRCNLAASNCVFDGNSTGNIGIYAYEDSELSLDDCLFTGHTGRSLQMGSSDITIADSNFHESAGTDCLSIGSSNVTIAGSHITNGNVGISTGGSSAISANVTVESCIIENCYSHGVNFTGRGTLAIKGSVVRNNQYNGISFDHSGSLTVEDSEIHNNYYHGIDYDTGNTAGTLTIDRCAVYDNGHSDCHGMYISNTSSASVTNCWIYDNADCGIHLANNNNPVTLRNNTICFNKGAYYEKGILCYGTAPTITNCIVWGHNEEELYNCTATYSCIEDCADASGTGNICGDANDPCFYDASSDDYHIKPESVCKDAGTGTFSSETDIDGEPRTANGGTDMGADEYYWPKADYNEDEIVNFLDYALFANEWLDTNDAISLDTDSDVDIEDLDLFSFDWLWEKAWGEGFMMMCMGGGGFGDSLFMTETLLTSLVDTKYEVQDTSSKLMIPDVAASISAMPTSVYAKAEKFYAINAFNNVHAIRQAAKEMAEFDIMDLIEWLDKLWESGELKEYETKAEYLEFRKALLELAEQQKQ